MIYNSIQCGFEAWKDLFGLRIGVANFKTALSTLRRSDFRLEWSDMRPGKADLRLDQGDLKLN